MRVFLHEAEVDLALPIDRLRELESVRLTDLRVRGLDPRHAGPEAIYDRLTSGTWLIADAGETVRLALIGGGSEAQAAYDLVARAQAAGALLKLVKAAAVALHEALHGPPDDDAGAAEAAATGESGGEASTPDASPMDVSDGAGGSDRPPCSDSTPERSDA